VKIESIFSQSNKYIQYYCLKTAYNDNKYINKIIIRVTQIFARWRPIKKLNANKARKKEQELSEYIQATIVQPNGHDWS